jgi:ferrous iron transport protein A
MSMVKKIKTLANLDTNKSAKIVSIEGGRGFQRKLRVMGIREGQKIKILFRQPFSGPVTLEVNGNQMTIGRGMTNKILVEET